jgi:DNA-directed RNA polymerase, mitochondrial
LLYKDSEEFKAEIGSTIFDILINKSNNLNLLQVDKTITIKEKKNIYITISDEFQEFFAKKVVSPYRLPMVVFPLEWTDNKNGGYLSKDYKLFINSSLVHKNFKNVEESEIGKIQMDTVNYLNKQEFKINKIMLNLLIKEYYSSSSILYNGLNKFKDIKSLENLDVNEKRKILSHNSKVYLYQKILSLAIIFKDLNFYIPTFLDFRGRIYTDVDYLSYQGEDMSRSLIEFNKGCYLNNNNIVFVLQYLANLAGKSKLTIVNKEK